MAGLRPGFGRGGMTHSFLMIMDGVEAPGAGAIDAMLFDVLIARVGGAGAGAGAGAKAIAGGEPADEGVDTTGEAISDAGR